MSVMRRPLKFGCVQSMCLIIVRKKSRRSGPKNSLRVPASCERWRATKVSFEKYAQRVLAWLSFIHLVPHIIVEMCHRGNVLIFEDVARCFNGISKHNLFGVVLYLRAEVDLLWGSVVLIQVEEQSHANCGSNDVSRGILHHNGWSHGGIRVRKLLICVGLAVLHV